MYYSTFKYFCDRQTDTHTHTDTHTTAVPDLFTKFIAAAANLRYRCSSRIELGYRTIYMAPRLLHSQTYIRMVCSTCTRRSLKY